MKKLLIAALLMAFSATGYADCHFKSPRSIMCLQPRNAVMAFQNFGPNNPKADTHHFKEYLNQFGCMTAAEIPALIKNNPFPEADDKQIYETGIYKVPTPDGYLHIGIFGIGGTTLYSEQSQLVGKCAVQHSEDYVLPKQ